jgi:hypothetical protein
MRCGPGKTSANSFTACSETSATSLASDGLLWSVSRRLEFEHHGNRTYPLVAELMHELAEQLLKATKKDEQQLPRLTTIPLLPASLSGTTSFKVLVPTPEPHPRFIAEKLSEAPSETANSQMKVGNVAIKYAQIYVGKEVNNPRSAGSDPAHLIGTATEDAPNDDGPATRRLSLKVLVPTPEQHPRFIAEKPSQAPLDTAKSQVKAGNVAIKYAQISFGEDAKNIRSAGVDPVRLIGTATEEAPDDDGPATRRLYYGRYYRSYYSTYCGAGQYSMYSSCYSCPGGQYQPYSGYTYCFGCPAGSYCPSGSISYTACPTGQYQPYSSQSSCISCPGGQYQPYSGWGSCIGCPAGYYCPSGSTTYSGCPAGYYCPSGSSAATSCPTGQYQPYTLKVSFTSSKIDSFRPHRAEKIKNKK